MIRPQGHSEIGRIICQIKIPLTPAGIETTAFRCVAQHLYHCATAVPLYEIQSGINIIIIIIIIIISFMQGIYTYIPDTNYVPREYSVAAILLLLFMVLISLVSVLNLLYFYISTFRSMCVQYPIWLFSAVPSLHVFPVCCSRIF